MNKLILVVLLFAVAYATPTEKEDSKEVDYSEKEKESDAKQGFKKEDVAEKKEEEDKPESNEDDNKQQEDADKSDDDTSSKDENEEINEMSAEIEQYQYTGATLGSGTDVRLVGGRGPFEGRVEVFFNGQWGTVCDDAFDIRDGHTICRYLGYPGIAAVYTRARRFGRGRGQIWFDNMACRGNEYSPFFCTKNQIGSHNCGHGEDAGVICRNKVRLRGGGSTYGRVEVYFNGVWGTVCDDFFDIHEANVICRQLGRPSASCSYPRARYGAGSVRQQIWLDDLRCLGTETEIGFCRSNPLGNHNCVHGEDASVRCR